MKKDKLILSLFCIALVVMTLVFANQLEMDSRKISDLEHQVELLENSTTTTIIEAWIQPKMWSQSGSPPWHSFTYGALLYGFQVVAADSTNGTSYVCNRAFGYYILGPLPNHLWISGTVKLSEAAQSGQSWSRIAFVMAVDQEGKESYIELDVHDSANSPVGPGKPGAWTDVYEYNKYQLRVGEERVFSFDIGQEYLNHYADSSYGDIVSIHLYFVLESQTATNGGWSIAYSLDDMGYWETT